MGERIKIGIIYENNENWIGGTYYIQNLVFALNKIGDNLKPHLVIICKTETEFEQINASGYPYMSWQAGSVAPGSLPVYKKAFNKLSNKLTGFDRFPQPLQLAPNDCSVIFPAPVGLSLPNNAKPVYWIPDFQEQVLPQFFSAVEILNRTQYHRFIADTSDNVVFSSKDAYDTFEELYPASKVKKHILNFAVSHSPAYKGLDIAALKVKYKIDKPYFFAPNQFWKHKNQQVVLKAIQALKVQTINNFIVVFSGKEYDYRNPDYFKGLQVMVAEYELQEQVRFVGFIDRNEQLKLMEGALAIIQPSLFEGWSTVVEDAKAMNQWVIASDLPVHREQLPFNVDFFDPKNEAALAHSLKKGIENGYVKTDFLYEQSIQKFAGDFINIVSNA